MEDALSFSVKTGKFRRVCYSAKKGKKFKKYMKKQKQYGLKIEILEIEVIFSTFFKVWTADLTAFSCLIKQDLIAFFICCAIMIVGNLKN